MHIFTHSDTKVNREAVNVVHYIENAPEWFRAQPQSLNPFHTLNPPPTQQPIRCQHPACCLQVSSYHYQVTEPTKPLGRRRWDSGLTVSQHLVKTNNRRALMPKGSWHDSFLIDTEVKEFPLLSASQSIVFQLCNTSNQISISRCVGEWWDYMSCLRSRPPRL